MTIKVNRYNVRFQGKTYGPGRDAGQIIEGLSEEEESLLIAGSNGTIEKYEVASTEKPQQVIVTDAPVLQKDGSREPLTDNTGVEYAETANQVQYAGILEVDPAKVTIDELINPVAVKTSTTKKPRK